MAKSDIENYLNAEYWRIKYFSLKGNWGMVIIVEMLVIISLLLKIYAE